jgi:hypothetical protein
VVENADRENDAKKRSNKKRIMLSRVKYIREVPKQEGAR